MKFATLVGCVSAILSAQAFSESPKFPQPSGDPILQSHGLNAALIYQDYGKWIDRRIDNQIEKSADSQAFLDDMGFMFGPQTHAISWWTGGGEMFDYFAGGIGFICRTNEVESEVSLFGTPLDVATECDWKLWRYEFDPSSDVFNELAGDAFELETAIEWVQGVDLDGGKLGDGYAIDWKTFPAIGNLDAINGATRQKTWSAKNCGAILDTLNRLEGSEAPQIDFEKYKDDAEENFYETGWLNGEVTLWLVNGVNITYRFGSDQAQLLLKQIVGITEFCEPDS